MASLPHPKGAPCVILDCPCESADTIRRARAVPYNAPGNPIRLDLFAGGQQQAPVLGTSIFSSEALNEVFGSNMRPDRDIEPNPAAVSVIDGMLFSGDTSIRYLHEVGRNLEVYGNPQSIDALVAPPPSSTHADPVALTSSVSSGNYLAAPTMSASISTPSSSRVPARSYTAATVRAAFTAATSPFPRLSSQAKRRKGLQALASAVVQKRKVPDEKDSSHKEVIPVGKMGEGGD